MLERILEVIKEKLKRKEITERIITTIEKTNDKEALDHCKMLLNVLEHSLVLDMEHYIHEYKENKERNYGPRLNTEE